MRNTTNAGWRNLNSGRIGEECRALGGKSLNFFGYRSFSNGPVNDSRYLMNKAAPIVGIRIGVAASFDQLGWKNGKG